MILRVIEGILGNGFVRQKKILEKHETTNLPPASGGRGTKKQSKENKINKEELRVLGRQVHTKSTLGAAAFPTGFPHVPREGGESAQT